MPEGPIARLSRPEVTRNLQSSRRGGAWGPGGLDANLPRQGLPLFRHMQGWKLRLRSVRGLCD